MAKHVEKRRFPRSLRKRRGVSQVVSTVILAGILLTLIGVAIFYATSLIDANRQQMEYESTKDMFIYTATALEQIALGAGGSRYIRFSLTSTGINFVKDEFGPLEVYVNGSKVIYDRETSSIIAVGGPLVTTVFRVLRPEITINPLYELNRIIVGPGEPMVVVYENFSGRAITYLKPTRVRVNYIGIFNLLENGTYKNYNYFVISYINLTIGPVGGSGHIPVIFRNRGIKTAEYKFDGTAINVTAVLGGHSESKVFEGDPGADGTIVIVRIAEVEVSTRG